MNAKKVIQHNVFSKSISHLLLILVPIFITGCQSLAPTKPVANIYGNIDVIKADFNHIAVTSFAQSQRLHVYIEGDGEAFEHRFFVSRDPGPRYPMFLTMMQQGETTENISLRIGLNYKIVAIRYEQIAREASCGFQDFLKTYRPLKATYSCIYCAGVCVEIFEESKEEFLTRGIIEVRDAL